MKQKIIYIYNIFVASIVCKANEMLCTFSRSIHISIFLYNVVLSFNTCSPPTLICMYALHNGAFYEQSEPKKQKKGVRGWAAHRRIIDGCGCGCAALVDFLALLIQFSRLLLSSYDFTHFIAVGRKADSIF
jgi:hypothetical protein